MTDAGPRVAIALVCLCGLAVAAVAAPGGAGAAGVPWFDDPGGQSGGGGGTPSGGSGGGGVDITEVVRLFCQVFDCSGGGGGGGGSPYQVTITPEPVPGRVVTATVTRDGRPVGGARVAFNGRYVGTTNASGQVRGEVPYVQEFRVSVVPPVGADPAEANTAGWARPVVRSERDPAGGGHRPSAAVEGPGSAMALRVDGGGSQVRAIGGSQPAARGAGSTVAQTEANVSRTYQLPGEATIALHGARDPGTRVTLVATVEGVPMRNASVAVDGRAVGRTGSDGRTRIRLPDDGRETITVRVERGAIGGETLVRLRVLGLDVHPTTGIVLPGTTVVVNATVGGQPRPGVPIRLEGERVARTGANGTARIELPWQGAARLEAVAIGQTATRHLRFLWLRLAGVGSVALALIGGVVAIAFRAEIVTRAVVAATTGAVWLAAMSVSAVDLGVRFVRWLAAGAPAAVRRTRDILRRGLHRAWRLAHRAGQALRRVAGALFRTARRLASRARRLLRRGWAAVSDPLGWLRRLEPRRLPKRLLAGARRNAPIWLGGVAVLAAVAAIAAPFHPAVRGVLWALAVGAAVLAIVTAVLRRSSDEAAGSGTRVAGATGASTAPDPGPSGASVRALWRRFARRVRPADWQRRTPGEVARAAVDRGLPAEPVDALTAAFRDVEYGGRPADRVRDRARAAFDRLREGG
jgi:hypothetical protein